MIDTDLEAEINPSIETEERIREQEERARRYMEAAAAAALEEARQRQVRRHKLKMNECSNALFARGPGAWALDALEGALEE